MKTKDRVLIKLLGKWRQRIKGSDYLSRPLVWLGGSSPPSQIQKSELIQIPTKNLVALC